MESFKKMNSALDTKHKLVPVNIVIVYLYSHMTVGSDIVVTLQVKM